jgi:hypothetical protein
VEAESGVDTVLLVKLTVQRDIEQKVLKFRRPRIFHCSGGINMNLMVNWSYYDFITFNTGIEMT